MTFVFFWKANNVYSQWYSSKFVENGVEFSNAEQYMMYHKAMLFNDQATARRIMQTADAKTVKALGRAVRNFDENTWVQNRERIIEQGNYLKFSQNPRLSRIMLATSDDTIFVEASPYDRIYGIGFAEAEAIDNQAFWGSNLLGKVLNRVKAKLQS